MEGWTTFDYVLAIWFATGFLTFTIAGMFQLLGLEKPPTDAIRTLVSREAFRPGKIGVEIESSTSGIVAAIGFVMLTSGMTLDQARQYLEGRASLFGLLVLATMAAYSIFRLSRALMHRSGSAE